MRSPDTTCCFVQCLQRWLAGLNRCLGAHCAALHVARRVWCFHARDPSLASRRSRAGRGRTGGPFSRTLLAPGPCVGGRVDRRSVLARAGLVGSLLLPVFLPAHLSTLQGTCRASSPAPPANSKPDYIARLIARLDSSLGSSLLTGSDYSRNAERPGMGAAGGRGRAPRFVA